MGTGYLKFQVYTGEHALPVAGIPITIRDMERNVLFELVTDINGLAGPIDLYAPDVERECEISCVLHADIIVEVLGSVAGYRDAIRYGVQIFDKETSILPVQLYPKTLTESRPEEIYIPKEHGADLEGPRFQNDDIQALEASLGRVLEDNNIIIPTHIRVHLGHPNSSARVITVPFTDYLKNVASSEIYPTWHESALVANILAQTTFTLNRLFTNTYP